jgi:hypothetical protein
MYKMRKSDEADLAKQHNSNFITMTASKCDDQHGMHNLLFSTDHLNIARFLLQDYLTLTNQDTIHLRTRKMYKNSGLSIARSADACYH